MNTYLNYGCNVQPCTRPTTKPSQQHRPEVTAENMRRRGQRAARAARALNHVLNCIESCSHQQAEHHRLCVTYQDLDLDEDQRKDLFSDLCRRGFDVHMMMSWFEIGW